MKLYTGTYVLPHVKFVFTSCFTVVPHWTIMYLFEFFNIFWWNVIYGTSVK